MIRTEHRDHTIMKRILSLLALILLICSPDMEAKADRQQEPDSVAAPVLLEGKKKTEAANRISSGYSDWKSVDMSGTIYETRRTDHALGARPAERGSGQA